ncbi:hypothetical protein [Clavibacter nebraskensis]|uniref:hypothetical protein n=1 Tax=Clavibacter nebraskensis TaxID=31963 RepID=UPI003F8748A6
MLDTVIAGVMLVLAVQILLPLVPAGLGEGTRIAVATVVCALLAGVVAAWSVARRRRTATVSAADAPAAPASASAGLGTPEASALLG